MLKGIEFLKEMSRAFKTSPRAGEVTELLRCARNDERQSEVGRSMIEMLGVLAVIGVLSVGGISGYSKAMEKWKANKLIDEYSNLIFNLQANVRELRNVSQKAPEEAIIGLVSYVQAASLVPETWSYVSSYKLYDSEKNVVQIFSRNNRLVIDLYFGGVLYGDLLANKSSGFSVTLCREIMQNLTKPLSSTLYFFRFIQWSKNEYANVYWGNETCSAGRKCLRDLTVAEINEMCRSCDKNNEACGINLEF